MRARSGAVREGDDWAREVKFDGMRAQLRWDRRALCLRSRPGRQLMLRSAALPRPARAVVRAAGDRPSHDAYPLYRPSDVAPRRDSACARSTVRAPSAHATANATSKGPSLGRPPASSPNPSATCRRTQRARSSPTVASAQASTPRASIRRIAGLASGRPLGRSNSQASASLTSVARRSGASSRALGASSAGTPRGVRRRRRSCPIALDRTGETRHNSHTSRGVVRSHRTGRVGVAHRAALRDRVRQSLVAATLSLEAACERGRHAGGEQHRGMADEQS